MQPRKPNANSRPGSEQDRLWSEVEHDVDALLEAEPIKEPQYRALIMSAQVGDLIKALTHDPVLNPAARPVGDEISFAADSLIQVLIYLRARGFSLREVYLKALQRMKEQVWKRDPVNQAVREPTQTEHLPAGVLAMGETAVPGDVQGRLVVIKSNWSANRATETLRRQGRESRLVVAMEDYPEELWDAVRDYFEYVSALVLRHAGKTSHPANVCRDHGRPCVVGVTGFENLNTGETVEVEAPEDGKAKIRRVGSERPTLSTFSD